MTDKLTWHDVLAEEKEKPYFIKLLKLVANARATGMVVYPQQKDVFNAFRLTELGEIKVVILGQDPYHGPNQAHGLAFSVLPGVPIPPSLQNVYKELEQEFPNFKRPQHGFLESWTRQGVLLLNTVLTVEAGKANSHAHFGWDNFTDEVLAAINKHREGIIFLLWGSRAQKKGSIIDFKRHHILKATHPSPLSAHRGFFGCGHFAHANALLIKSGQIPINWIPQLMS
ncbi:uracil-DNA glycosylase [Pantoea sp. Nvir]|uniref:uracil-DNA glycosylase n=1 Tax=Pantoea sp. Nvir TaxID=2576760 RepID=UPI0013579B86|nr:uracil-DNA glycosylase [Pantoea sp. Nvir]MXP66529.1 uracil-DNA glycosylase [Pantoea sp. Nvir]CAJ0992284.1 Uracil-DNA glycosylase [Pantoea sp. Nvir]